MPQINILNILEGDNQSTIVDKINYNFDQILSAGGGPQGQQGSVGPTGPIGPQGAQGVNGLQGPSGTKWFVQDNAPASGSIGGNNPFLFPSFGDYWLDPDSASQEIYVFDGSSWTYTGFGLGAGEIFQRLSPINHSGGLTGRGVLFGGTAGDQTLVLSDSDIDNYKTGLVPNDNINYEDYKLKIATRDTRIGIISIGRSDHDTLIDTSSTGNSNNSLIYWNDINPAGAGYWSTTWRNPAGSITIQSLGAGSAGGINLLATEEVTAQSNNNNIGLITDSPDKGTFVNVNSTRGFLEISSTYPTNSTNPYLFINSTGAGIGVGTGGFKETGNDARKLSVFGNTSIGKTSSTHTGDMFVGGGTGIPGYNNGSLFVEGHVGFGYKNPTGGNGGPSTTGPAESQNRFPELWVSSYNRGPGIQVKTLGDTNTQGRTTIGDGTYDYQGAAISDRVVAGTGPDISQEYYVTGSPTFSTNAPLISYQHKITDSTNTTGTAPVFSVTTFTGSNSVYNNTTIAGKTLIQTRNSNSYLEIRANSNRTSSSTSINHVSLGTQDEGHLTVHAGPTSDPKYGTTTIGYDSDTIKTSEPGQLASNFTSTTLKGALNQRGFYPVHGSTITGVQTIGTNESKTLIRSTPKSSIGVIKGFPPTLVTTSIAGSHSMQKIHRNLFASTTNSAGLTTATGPDPRFQNYPNGLEITSYISPNFGNFSGYVSSSPNNRSSFAIAVSATSEISETITFPFVEELPRYANPTGFFVSDTGTNVSIGMAPLFSAALEVDSSGSPYPNTTRAISATGDSRFTGDVDIIGNLGVTGDVEINGSLEVNSEKVGSLQSGITSVPLNFSGSSPTAITPVLSADKTTYFWFGGTYTYVYLDVEEAPGSGTWIPTARGYYNSTALGSNSNIQNVIVPAGCRVRISINVSGGATAYYREFGI